MAKAVFIYVCLRSERFFRLFIKPCQTGH